MKSITPCIPLRPIEEDSRAARRAGGSKDKLSALKLAVSAPFKKLGAKAFMRPVRCVCFFIMVCLTEVELLSASDTPVNPVLTAVDFEKKLREGYERAGEAVQNDTLQQIEVLKENYKKALGRVFENYSQAGNTAGALGVRAELERIAEGVELTEEQLADQALSNLREPRQKFLQGIHNINRARDLKTTNLLNAGVRAMNDFARVLTKEQRMDEVVELQGIITRWEQEIPPAPDALPPGYAEGLVDEHIGKAGTPNWTSDNIYTFRIFRPIRRLEIVFYASPSKEGDSRGTITLIRPDGTRESAGTWSTEMFRRTAWEATSYKDVDREVIETNLSLSEIGEYRIQFDYTGGSEALFIHRVEIGEG